MDTDDVFACMEIEILDEASAPKPSAKKRKKPHVLSSWAHELTHELIQAVEGHECIWMYSCPDYKDRGKRDQAWQEVAAGFEDHNVESCKARWANIKC